MIGSMLLKLKGYAIIIGVALLTVLSFMARIFFLKKQRDHLREKAEAYKAQAEQEIAINEAESEIEQEFSHRASVAKKDIERGQMPDNIRNRNS